MRRIIKLIFQIVAVLVGLVAVIALIGMMLPQKHTARTKTTLNVPPPDVWEALINIPAFPAWRSDVKSVEVLPPGNGRPAWEEVGANSTISYEQMEASPPSRLVVRLTDDSLPFGGTWTYELKAVASGTEITITEDGIVRNPVFRFVSRFIFGHHRTQEIFLGDLGKRFRQPVTVVRVTD